MEEDKKQNSDKNIKVLRTYTSDMADVIRDNEVSVIKIALAEKEKKEMDGSFDKAYSSRFTKIFMFVGGIILIAGAVIGSILIFQKKEELSKPQVKNVSTFISYDLKSEIDVTEASSVSSLMSLIKRGWQSKIKNVEAIFLMKQAGEQFQMLTSKEFLFIIDSTIPESLERSLSNKYLLGRYSNPAVVSNEYSTFIIFETTDYNLAYASMLEWEKTMLRDLYLLLNIQITNNSLFEKSWSDIIVDNRDTRVLYGENGQGILYYAFVNKDNFVISNSLETLKEIMNRLIIKNS